MAARKEINERALLEYSRCLLRLPEENEYSPTLEEQVTNELLRRLFLNMFAQGPEALPAPPAMRRLFADIWKEMVPVGYKTKSPKDALTIVRRVGELLQGYRIYSPVSKYALMLGKVSITGEYAVMTSRAQGKPKLLLVLRPRFDQILGRPDVVDYSRWLHLRHHEPTIPEIKVMHFSFISDWQWTNQSVGDERVIRDRLTTFAGTIMGTVGYPSPGTHCNNCLTRGCLVMEKAS